MAEAVRSVTGDFFACVRRKRDVRGAINVPGVGLHGNRIGAGVKHDPAVTCIGVQHCDRRGSGGVHPIV